MIFTLLSVLAATAAQPAAPAPNAPIVYDATFYAQFQPQTALDMLQRTPGFVLETTDEEIRGFGGSAGNVLVNGGRPTIKAGGIEAFLVRIAADRVERIELLRGGLNAEAQGKTLVANIVLKADAGASGNLAIELRRAPGDRITPRIDTSYSFAADGWDLSAGLVAFYERNPLGGRYTVTRSGEDPQDALETLGQSERAMTLTASAARPAGGGSLTINARLDHSDDRYSQRLMPVAHDIAATRIDGRNKDWSGEIGGDWARGLGAGWNAKIVALARDERQNFSERAEDSAFLQRTRSTELLARGTFNRDSASWLRPEIAAEIAWNRGKSTLALSENGVPVELAGSDSLVTELRGEIVSNLVASIAANARIEAGLGYEHSRISVAGAGRSARELGFWKPVLALAWDVTAATQFRIEGRRTVGQLDFANFAATGNLVDDRPIAGNAELRPEVTDALTLKLDHRFGKGGALSLTGARETVKDALAYVSLASGGEALLNVGRVDAWRIAAEATLPLDTLIDGARFTANGERIWAHRVDPITGRRRKDERDSAELTLAFRHDVKAWRSAYGFSFEASSPERAWYVAEFSSERFRPYLVAYVETMAIAGFKTTVTISGVTGDRSDRRRYFYSPDRAGAIESTEFRQRTRGAYLNVLFSKQL